MPLPQVSLAVRCSGIVVPDIDLYGHVQRASLYVEGSPVDATLELTMNGITHTFHFIRPQPLVPLLAVFEGFRSLRIIDRNREQQQFLEFGRYRIELRDEDNRIGKLTADAFEHVTRHAT